MPPNFPGLHALSSKPFEIKASDKSYFIEKKILAGQWELYSTKDVASEKIDLSEWDGGTVGRFIEFLYTKDYSVDEPDFGEEEIEEVESHDSDDGGGDVRERIEEDDTLDTAQNSAEPGELVVTDTSALFIHAKLYTLAESKGFKALQEMAFERLEAGIRGIDEKLLERDPIHVENINILLQHIYSRAHPYSTRVEPVQDLVSDFAAKNFEKLMEAGGYMRLLLIKGGVPACRLMMKVSERLYSSKEPVIAGNRILDLQREVRNWKDRATVSEEKLQRLGISNAEELQRLKAMVRELEAINAKMQLSGITNVEKVGTINPAKIWQLEIANTQRLRHLQATNTTKIQNLETIITEKIRQLEISSARIKQLEGHPTDKAQRLETAHAKRMQQLEAIYAGRMQQLETTHTERMQKLEEANIEIIQQRETFNTEEATTRIQQLEAEHTEKMRHLRTTYLKGILEKIEKTRSELQNWERPNGQQ